MQSISLETNVEYQTKTSGWESGENDFLVKNSPFEGETFPTGMQKNIVANVMGNFLMIELV